jgi:hypothetical protein
MTVEISLSRAASLSEAKPSLAARIAALKAYLMMCAETCADYYAAAAVYEQLSGLSDAELSRRGLARDTLARDIASLAGRAQ